MLPKIWYPAQIFLWAMLNEPSLFWCLFWFVGLPLAGLLPPQNLQSLFVCRPAFSWPPPSPKFVTLTQICFVVPGRITLLKQHWSYNFFIFFFFYVQLIWNNSHNFFNTSDSLLKTSTLQISLHIVSTLTRLDILSRPKAPKKLLNNSEEFLSLRPTKLLKNSKRFQKNSKRFQRDSKRFQRDSKRFQKIPKDSKRFQKIPKDSERIQKILKESKRFWKNPKDSKRIQKALKEPKRFLKISKRFKEFPKS